MLYFKKTRVAFYLFAEKPKVNKKSTATNHLCKKEDEEKKIVNKQLCCCTLMVRDTHVTKRPPVYL